METYTIIPRAGTYKVVGTTAEGKRTLVATYPTEQAAISRLKRLQEKTGVDQPAQRRLRDWLA
jgi:hypothetical protein